MRRRFQKTKRWHRAASHCTLLLLTFLSGCRQKHALPQPGSTQYLHFVSAFYTGLAGLQVGDDTRAESSLAESVKLAPGEPAAWVDWGVLALRQRGFDAAAERFSHARTLAPGNAQIPYLQGLLESERGNSAAAITSLQASLALNGNNLRALYQLASEIERQGDPASDRRYEQVLQQILRIAPANLAAQLDLARIAAKLGDVATLHTAVADIATHQAGWPAEATAQLALLQAAADSPQPRAAATRSTFLHNVLMRVPAFRNDLADLTAPAGEAAEPMTRFLLLPSPPDRPALPDTGLSFETKPFGEPETAGSWTWAGALYLNGTDAPALAQANSKTLRFLNGTEIPFPGGSNMQTLTPESILAADFNYDFKSDLVLAGAGGIRLFTQGLPTHFTEVTAAAKLPAAVVNAPYTGAWALDIEADGDLDILLGTASGPPTLLRNNGDGTFMPQRPFPGIDGLRQLAWADLNGDGNPDAALLDSKGRLHIFLNRRSGSFTEVASIANIKAITVGGVSADNKFDTLDLLALENTGRIVRFSTPDEGRTWQSIPLAQTTPTSGESRLLAADLDNNGAVDIIVAPAHTAPQILLGTDRASFEPLKIPALPPTQALADVKDNGHLTLIGLEPDGRAVTADSRSSKNYKWQTIRPHARQATGDQRVNPFGIGGEIEIRAGLLTQRQPIATPALHFGLGEQNSTDVARILWPNGSVRAEFALKADQQIVTEQRLKGSCPFLFAWNGHEMTFVKDSVPWGSALGLRINALGAASIAATEEWYKISRDQLHPHDGVYDLRITGELWESYYYDSLALMTVDHPAGTEVFTDERFRVPSVKLAVTAVAAPQPLIRAVDDNGTDVTGTLESLDGHYLDTFGRGQYQGVTRDHWVELTLPDALPPGPLWLIAKGWLHPSDSSINIALAQGSEPKPKWLSLEVPDKTGHWRVANPNLGFPAGRNKICLFDLTGLWKPGEPHRLRLRTNLEVYWDQIEWAQGLPSTSLHMERLHPSTADLRYRGFSTIHQADASSPEIPTYNQLSGTAPRWRDLAGFYTRYGDVRQLLAGVDDRYVIMNAGDEMSLQFAAPPPPKPGFVRDFILAGDGWIKDGDYNSTYSQTVLPYPYHARRSYNSAPGALEDDYVYRHHKEDWMTYQTRYIMPDAWIGALRGSGAQ